MEVAEKVTHADNRDMPSLVPLPSRWHTCYC